MSDLTNTKTETEKVGKFRIRRGGLMVDYYTRDIDESKIDQLRQFFHDYNDFTIKNFAFTTLDGIFVMFTPQPGDIIEMGMVNECP